MHQQDTGNSQFADSKSMDTRKKNIYVPLEPDIIPNLMGCMDQILVGNASFRTGEKFGMPIKIYEMGTAVFLCD